MRTLNIFDQGIIEVDEGKTVKDLSMQLVEEVGLWVDDARYATVYDPESEHVCSDPDQRISEAIKGEDVCISYVIPGVFYFVEGGWGKKTLDMDCKGIIPDPVAIRVLFDGFDNVMVVNGNMTLEQFVAVINGHILVEDEGLECRVGEYGVLGAMLPPMVYPGETVLKDINREVFIQIIFPPSESGEE